jgi:hypothetical protein
VEKCITFEANIQAPGAMSDFFTDIAQLSFKTRLEELKDYAHASFDIQNEQLFNLLNEAQGCLYGKKYDFRSIFSYQDFRERLPILQNSDIQPYLRKMAAGKPNILCRAFVSILSRLQKTAVKNRKQQAFFACQRSNDQREFLSGHQRLLCSVFEGSPR